MTLARSSALVAALVASASAGLGCSFFDEEHNDASAAPAQASDVIAGCEDLDPDSAPDDLKCTGLYADFASKTLAARPEAFAPAHAFWSDGAAKSRWVDMPDGATIDTTSMDDWVYPIGTKVWKEIRVGGHRVETRFMNKVRDDRWLTATYAWSADETISTKSSGADVDLGGGATWTIPDSTQCDDCHKGKKDRLLGFEAISLALPEATGLNLGELIAEGRLSAPPAKTMFNLPDDGTGKAGPALAWLHVNCGTSCHTGTSTGTAYGTDLQLRIGWDELTTHLPVKEWAMLKGTIGVPIKSPSWAGATRITPGAPETSELYELLAERGNEQMPPEATTIVDASGVAVVGDWISALKYPGTIPREQTATPVLREIRIQEQ